MPTESEQRALDQIKAYLDAGHSLDAVRDAGWSSWIDHLEAAGYDLRTGQLKLAPPEDVPPADAESDSPQQQAAEQPIATPDQPARGVPRCPNCGAERVGTRPYCVSCPTKWPEGTPPGHSPETQPWFKSKWAWAVAGVTVLIIGLIVLGVALGGDDGNSGDDSRSLVLNSEDQDKSLEGTEPTEAPKPSETPGPSPTAGPTSTPRPTRTPRPTQPPPYKLALVSASCTLRSDIGFTECSGFVRNLTSQSLDNVTVVITWVDSNGTPQTADDALIDFNPLLPDQESPWSTVGTYNPALDRFRVQFKELLGGTILTRDDRQ